MVKKTWPLLPQVHLCFPKCLCVSLLPLCLFFFLFFTSLSIDAKCVPTTTLDFSGTFTVIQGPRELQNHVQP